MTDPNIDPLEWEDDEAINNGNFHDTHVRHIRIFTFWEVAQGMGGEDDPGYCFELFADDDEVE